MTPLLLALPVAAADPVALDTAAASLPQQPVVMRGLPPALRPGAFDTASSGAADAPIIVTASVSPMPLAQSRAAVDPPPVTMALAATVPVRFAPQAADSDHIVVTAAVPGQNDPLEGFNRTMFGIQMGLDKVLIRPLAMAYKTVVPKPVRSGLRNFFRNLTEPLAFLNDLLQLRFKRAAETFGRFAINTVLGIGGFLDVATPEGVPHHDNSFGDTLAYYGIGPGPYLFLPFVGPTTLRDLLSSPADGAVLPVLIGTPFDRAEYQIPKAVITGLDQRAESDADLKALYRSAVDPYATLRSVYLQNRAAEVAALKEHDAAKPAATQDDPLADPLSDPSAGSSGDPLTDPLTDPAASGKAKTMPTPANDPLTDPLQDPAATAPSSSRD
ncbi:VacJ family lipoprotein [Stakelama sediminis]|uniref:Phospholipid-binding lipoprotein MlaA n=1 Tax=Stakelama sediminis TaxID=463200 RepID=A0A840Z1V1_9SPHN|nr:VacJ family lipoprotein [Stakelama sediminis]MBB5719662.1 phospholipid-binding lipoprotein MlaA [Stakelama sediminis]